jgi:hypothetical protein
MPPPGQARADCARDGKVANGETEKGTWVKIDCVPPDATIQAAHAIVLVRVVESRQHIAIVRVLKAWKGPYLPGRVLHVVEPNFYTGPPCDRYSFQASDNELLIFLDNAKDEDRITAWEDWVWPAAESEALLRALDQAFRARLDAFAGKTGTYIPELGVVIPISRPNMTEPEVIPRVDGYFASLEVGRALDDTDDHPQGSEHVLAGCSQLDMCLKLSISRLEEPVPTGSDVRDSNYRTVQQAAFGEDLGPKVHGEVTSIDGHPAWTNSSARPVKMHAGKHSPPIGIPWGDLPVVWTSVTYVIADQHLYRFVVVQVGWDKPPLDFTAVVQAVSAATFAPVEVPDGVTPSGLLKMPPHHWDKHFDYYPDTEKSRGDTGSVDLEFSIDTKGHVRDDIRWLGGHSREFDESAADYFLGTTFDVGPDWAAKGYDKLRFRTQVQFGIRPALWLSLHMRGGFGCGKPERFSDADPALMAVRLCDLGASVSWLRDDQVVKKIITRTRDRRLREPHFLKAPSTY